MSLDFILFATLVALLGFSLYALLLQCLTALYQIKGITFFRATLVLLSYSVVVIICAVVGSMSGVSGLFNTLGLLVGSIVAYRVHKKYSAISTWRFIAIWVTYLAVGLISGLVAVATIRVYIAQPFVVTGDSMSPAYPTGEYLIVEEWNKIPHKGDVVIANISSQYVIARVAGVSGDVVAGIQVPSGEYYLSKDNPSATQVPGLVLWRAIVGKLVLDLGHTNF